MKVNRRENITSPSDRRFSMGLLQNLNAKQREAVEAPTQPMLVLAGPGTGKTRTLITRILYLIEDRKIAPHKILAVTFTNKAKEEMRSRLRDELGDLAGDVLIGTFHHYCLEVLRTHHHEAKLPKQFSIADEQTQLLTLSRASRIQDAKSLRNVLTAIGSYRVNKAFLNPAFQGIAEKWLAPYQQELRKHHLIDFDQIVLLTRKLFESSPEVVEREQQRFEAILIDEFQDTDPVQYHIIRRLAEGHGNIFAVADDDQSIFAWRGANVENIQRYIKDFDCQERVIVLEQNYRSAQCIIDLAAQLLDEHRSIAKKLQSANPQQMSFFDAERRFLRFDDDREEVEFIVQEIRKLTGKIPPAPPSEPGEADPPPRKEAGAEGIAPFSFADIAILYPNHAIGEKLETSLLSANIPCQLVKRQGVFEHEDIRKLLLLFKLLLNPADDVALEQFFELELDNALVFQQLTALRNKFPTFKQTLYAAARQGISGISKGQLWRKISASFGLISNLISYIESNPQSELEELINRICNLALPEHSLSLHGKVHDLCDPFEIPGMAEAVTAIRRSADNGEQFAVHGCDAELARLCCVLLNHSQSGNSPGEQPLEALCRVFSDPEIVLESALSLFLCLDPVAAELLQNSLPENVDIILISSPRHAACSKPQLGNSIVIDSALSVNVTVFKLLQALSSSEQPKAFRNYVVLDLETTSGDSRTTGIVEIGAVKVRDGQIVEEFGTLVNPEIPITQGAFEVHGISDNDVKDQPTFQELLPDFLAFIGDDLLVAHNGFGFDFPILWRLYREATGELLPNRRFDTLPLARRLFPGQKNGVDGLMERFGIEDLGGRHRALDDTIYLAPIFERLQEVEQSFNRRTEFEELLEIVALGQFLERQIPPGPPLEKRGNVSASPLEKKDGEDVPPFSKGGPGGILGNSEEAILFQLGARKLLSRFSELPESLRELFELHEFDIQQTFEQFNSDDDDGVHKALEAFNGREIALTRIKELARAFPAENLRDALQQFLDHATLYSTQDDLRQVNAVNLFTIHSSKGLEFPVVFIAGVEKGNLPSFYSVREEGDLREKKLDEQRRLFYVAMTRAKYKLFVSYVNKRGDFPKKRSQFLIELGVETDEMPAEFEENV